MKTAAGLRVRLFAKKRNSKTFLHYNIMVAIGMLWLFFFNIVPMFGIVIAFEDYNPTQGLWGSEFVGLEHFEYLFSMSDSRRVIVNTLVIAVSKLVLNIVVPLAFALLLNEVRKLRFKKFVQTVVYLPHFLSWVILASVLLEIFGYRGVFNSLLSVLSFQASFQYHRWNPRPVKALFLVRHKREKRVDKHCAYR